MYQIISHVRPNGEHPFKEYLDDLERTGNKKDAAKIHDTIDRLSEWGSQKLVEMRWAEKMNDVWCLRRGAHRVFYFWSAHTQTYVLLQGFRKKTPKTPAAHIQRAEELRLEYLDHSN